MAGRKRWIWLGIAIGIILLSLWGLWGEGTASKLLPEKKEIKKKTVTVSESSEGEPEAMKAVKRYDASLYVRSKPIKDPFHGEAIAKEAKTEKEAKVSASKESARKVAKASSSQEPVKKKETAMYPKLQGIMAFGNKKRAVIEWNGESYTVGEGEQVGLWTVSGIEKRTVTLTGSPGTLTLSTR